MGYSQVETAYVSSFKDCKLDCTEEVVAFSGCGVGLCGRVVRRVWGAVVEVYGPSRDVGEGEQRDGCSGEEGVETVRAMAGARGSRGSSLGRSRGDWKSQSRKQRRRCEGRRARCWQWRRRVQTSWAEEEDRFGPRRQGIYWESVGENLLIPYMMHALRS